MADAKQYQQQAEVEASEVQSRELTRLASYALIVVLSGVALAVAVSMVVLAVSVASRHARVAQPQAIQDGVAAPVSPVSHPEEQASDMRK